MKSKQIEILEKVAKGEFTVEQANKELLILLSVNERCLHINDAIMLIKSMPTDQAIQKIKAIIANQPETTVINGELLITINIGK